MEYTCFVILICIVAYEVFSRMFGYRNVYIMNFIQILYYFSKWFITEFLLISDVIKRTFTEKDGSALTIRTFQESVQAVLNNAKDWNGRGYVRKQKLKDYL